MPHASSLEHPVAPSPSSLTAVLRFCQTRGERPALPKECAQSKVAEIIKHCWAEKPEQRPSFEKLVEELASNLEKQVVSGGRLIWRSASLNPPYVKVLAAHGFECHCVHRITDKEYNGCIDRVNMYASFWYADRK